MKPPPFLLGLTLLFWGWQTDLLLVGALLGVVLESAQVFKLRWEFADEEFGRVWTFCALLLLAAILYAFTENEGPKNFGALLDDATAAEQRTASVSGARTVATVLRWLPMLFYPFLLMQTFSTREGIPLATISLILQRRWKQAKRLGQPVPPTRNVNIGYIYFCGAIFSASFHPADGNNFFWGVCGLLALALWPHRSRRFAMPLWLGIMVVAGTLGYFGQRGLTQIQGSLEFLRPQWIARFLSRRTTDAAQTRTMIGRIGNLKLSGQIVIRVEPESAQVPPEYLRETSYRRYDRQSWFAGSSRNDYSDVLEEQPTPSGRWNLLGTKSNLTTVRIACYLDGEDQGTPAGLLPLPAGTTRLEQLPAYTIKTNSSGAALATGPGLLLFKAQYGPGLTMDAPPDVDWTNRTRWLGPPPLDRPGPPGPGRADRTGRSGGRTNSEDRAQRRLIGKTEDTSIPELEAETLDQVIAELGLKGETNLSVVLPRLQTFFNDKFTYRLWQPRSRKTERSENPLGLFLLTERAGHCEYFATATVLLLRRLEIPARYAVGYVVHEASGSGYVVRASDAHAWTLVWDEARGIWQDFETTPPSWMQEERKQRSAFQWLNDFWTRLKFELSKFRWGQSQIRQYLLWIMIPGLLLLLYQILFRRGRQRKRGPGAGGAGADHWPGLDSEFYELEKRLAAGGALRSASEPLLAWRRRLGARPELAGLQAPLAEVLRLHYQHRFDPRGLTRPERTRLQELVRDCLKQLTQAPSPTTDSR